MRCHRPRALGIRLAALVAGVALVCAVTADASDTARRPEPLDGPQPLEGFDIGSLSGEWFEVAAWGTAWAHRRCVSDTRFRFTVVDARRIDASRSCTTARGLDVRGGRLRAPDDATGALRGRFVNGLFGWLPAASADYWVLASGSGNQWLLIGDRQRERLAVWSRTVALDEGAVAAAIAAGRSQGFDARLLTAVAHPGGPGELVRVRPR